MPSHSNTATISRNDSPIEWSRTPNTLTGVGVRSFSQTSSQSTLNVSLSRSPSFMVSARYDLLTSQATSTRHCPLAATDTLLSCMNIHTVIPDLVTRVQQA